MRCLPVKEKCLEDVLNLLELENVMNRTEMRRFSRFRRSSEV